MNLRSCFKGVALANFGLGLAFIVWVSCYRQAGSDSAPAPSTLATDPAASAPGTGDPAAANGKVADTPGTLSRLAEVVACLEAGGGVRGQRCVKPATVRGIQQGGPNDRYFAATKALVLVEPPSGAVTSLADACRRRPEPQAQAQAQQAQAPPPAVSDAEVLACVLADLELRTRVE